MSPLPSALESVFAANPEPEALFAALLPAVCETLHADRCFLLLRNPKTRMHRNLCWRTRPDLPDTSTDGWEPEQEWERDDPMFAAAVRADDSIFVEDIETAGPDVLNVEFERENLGHRALVHAHIRHAGETWGILQPCVFEQPRPWSGADRNTINALTERLVAPVVAAVRAAGV